MSFLFPLLFPLGAEIAKLYLGVIPTFPRAGQHCAPLPAQQPRGDSGYMGQGLDLGADRKATQTAGVWVMYPLCMDGDLALQDQVQVIYLHGITEKFRLQKKWDNCMGWKQECTVLLL